MNDATEMRMSPSPRGEGPLTGFKLRLCYKKRYVLLYTCNTMRPETFGLLVFGVTAAWVLLATWLIPMLNRRRQEREQLALAKMHRFAMRHNTFVRNHQGLRYVVVLGKQGFCYMLGGEFVSRERLLRALGEENEKHLLKAESEESQHSAIHGLVTIPA